jgi:hypothetical protein
MRYRLRTLVILLAVLPPALAWGWVEYGKHRERAAMKRAVKEFLQRLHSHPSYPVFQ